MPSFAFAEAPATVQPTPTAELNQRISRAVENKQAWVQTDLAERLSLLNILVERTVEHADRWARAEANAKGLDPDGPEINEGYQNVFASLRGLTAMKTTLRALQKTGKAPTPAGGYSARADGRIVAHTMPESTWDKLLFPGITGEVWMEPGVTRETVANTQALEYASPSHPQGRVSLVLGAGNQSSIPYLDALTALYDENCVVIIKMNPVNESLGPIFHDIWKPFVDRGWAAFVYGGADVGKHLTHHSDIDKVHITGSDATHAAILWGPHEGRDARKASGDKILDIEITSELGNVTPVIVVPAKWSAKDMEFQVRNVASMLTHNASFNCLALKVLVTSADWPQRTEFLDKLRTHLGTTGTRQAYYPGAQDRWSQFQEAYPNGQSCGTPGEGELPWLVIDSVDPTDSSALAFKKEAWCGVLAETALPGATAADFLPGAVAFCNDTLWGTLACGMLVHPSITKDPSGNAAVETALDELRYGSITLNHNPFLGYGLPTLPWGAHPGHTLADIGSGIGKVHNSLLYSRTQKGVVRGPWGFLGKPPWFPDHARAHQLWPRLVRFEAKHSVLKLPGIFSAFLRG
jgi:hypothetical protein